MATAAAAASAGGVAHDVAVENPTRATEEMITGEEDESNDAAPENHSRPGHSKPKDTKISKSKPKTKTNVRFGTIGQLQNQDSSSDEEGQAFYAGGSVHSGQQVLGPSKKNDIINDMFKTCQGQSIAPEERPTSQHPHRPNTFSGTGYKLGQTCSDTEGLFLLFTFCNKNFKAIRMYIVCLF